MDERERAGVRRSHELARLIIEQFAPVDGFASARLPTERQLALDLGSTRTAVRNALGLLEAEGRISREVGRGTFLLAAGEEGLDLDRLDDATRSDDIGPAHVIAARRAIEPTIMPLVVAWATEQDFEEIDRCLVGGDAAATSEEFEAWDLALHRAIAAASHNQLVVRMYGAVETARRGRLWGSMKRRSDTSAGRECRRTEHRALVAALRSRDVDDAVRATSRHLDQVEATLLGRVDLRSDVLAPR